MIFNTSPINFIFFLNLKGLLEISGLFPTKNFKKCYLGSRENVRVFVCVCVCFTGTSQTVSSKHVLIMDEVDGMAGNEDRGGIQVMQINAALVE